jgi:iron complex outermembrane receptor protein
VSQELRIASPGNAFIDYTAACLCRISAPPLIPRRRHHPVRLYSRCQLDWLTFRTSDDSMAIYGQATVHAAAILRLIAGRYTTERLGLDNHDYDFRSPSPTSSTPATCHGNLAPNTMWPAAPWSMPPPSRLQERPDQRAGLPAHALYRARKSPPAMSWASNPRCLADGWPISACFPRPSGISSSSNAPTPRPARLSCTAVNVDGVKSRGAEISLFGKITHDLSVSTGFIYAKATYPAGYTTVVDGHLRFGRHTIALLAALQIHLLGRLQPSGH